MAIRHPVADSLDMWHDVGVISSSTLSYRFAAITLLLTVGGIAQNSVLPADRTHPDVAAEKNVESQQLFSLEQAQSQAITSGDTSRIAATSQDLAKWLLQRLATLETAKGDTKAADEAAEQARLLSTGEAGVSPDPSGPTIQQPRPSRSASLQQTENAYKEKLKKLLAQSYNDLGTAEARQGQYAAAKSHFEFSAQWDKPTLTLLRNLGTVAFRTGDFATAARAFAQYLQPASGPANAADSRSQLMYALSLFSTGDFPGAAHAFTPVGTDAMSDARSAYSWAFSLAHSGDPKQANTIATQLSSQPLTPDVLSLVCHVFIDTESYQQSIECYRKIVAADPSFRFAHYQIAESLIHLDRPAEAIPELREELTLSPDDPNVEYSLAFALLQTSNKEEARKLLLTITAAHPEMAQAQYQLGKLLLDAGDVPIAISHLELAEQDDTSLDYVHYQLQAAYRKVGRTADAEREAGLYREIKARRRDLPSHAP